jgi:hypothetical protein
MCWFGCVATVNECVMGNLCRHQVNDHSTFRLPVAHSTSHSFAKACFFQYLDTEINGEQQVGNHQTRIAAPRASTRLDWQIIVNILITLKDEPQRGIQATLHAIIAIYF